MNITQFFTLYAISVPIFFIIDMVWLGFVASDFYRTRLAHVIGDINWTAAIIFYFIFLIGLVIFAIYPAVARGEWQYALLYGGMFGFFTYATYDLTNLATLRDWPLSVTLVDMAWGTVLGGLVSTITYLVYAYYLA
jgi:uncharacterized membrane protein